MREYLHQPESTAKAVRDGWLDTGDLGFEQDGELFVTGRAKDVIIVRGANHSPEEIEAAVSDLPQVRTGCAAAVGHLPEGATGEQVWLFVERPRGGQIDEDEETVEHCRHQVLAHVGVDLGHVEVLEPGTLPRTSSGKIRRQRTLELFLADQLEAPPKVTPARILRAMGRSAWARWRPRKASNAD
jgi:acyl-CoA synthetase (AMP-forming)/AMP-acid ligase II